MNNEKLLIKILDEVQHSGDMSFTCPYCKSIVDLDNPQCDCGFKNPIANGMIDLKNPFKERWLK